MKKKQQQKQKHSKNTFVITTLTTEKSAAVNLSIYIHVCARLYKLLQLYFYANCMQLDYYFVAFFEPNALEKSVSSYWLCYH